MRQANRIVIAIWVLLGVFVLTLADWQFGGLRLASRGVTLLAGFAALWLPMVCVVSPRLSAPQPGEGLGVRRSYPVGLARSRLRLGHRSGSGHAVMDAAVSRPSRPLGDRYLLHGCRGLGQRRDYR